MVDTKFQCPDCGHKYLQTDEKNYNKFICPNCELVLSTNKDRQRLIPQFFVGWSFEKKGDQ